MSVSRVRYRERQPLGAADLNEEQAYRSAMRRHHNLAHHGWGIVQGLDMSVEGESLIVEAGLAVDGYGRELIVPEPVLRTITVWFDKLGSDALDVWLLYSKVAETPPQRGHWDCGPGKHSRWYEEARLRLTTASTVDPRRPAEFTEADLDFRPHETLPDDPDREWPVYLGRVTRTSTNMTTDMANRPYVTLVAESIVSPSGRARMQVGAELTSDRRRFAVSLLDENEEFVDQISLDSDGNTFIRGNTTLTNGNLILAAAEARQVTAAASDLARLCGHEGEPTEEDQVWSITFKPLDTAPEEAMPWKIYRTAITQDERSINQLRLEIGHPGDKGDPTRSRLAIGQTDENGNFVRCLTIRADCTVIVHGNLAPQGQVLQGPIEPNPDDPRFGLALMDRWLRGLTTAGTQLDSFYLGDPYPGAFNVTLNFHGVDRVIVGQVFYYEVHVENTGSDPITYILVYEVLTIDGAPRRRRTIRSGLTLNSGESQNISMSYENAPAGRQLTIAITAFGVGPAGNLVTASGTGTVEIVPDLA